MSTTIEQPKATVLAEGRQTIFMKHGVVVPKNATVAQALKAGGLDFKVETVALKTADGTEVPNRFAVRRADTGQVFDVVGRSYVPIQNVDAFGVAEGVQQVLDIEFGAAGVTASGKVCWLQAKLPGLYTPVVGDPHEMHLLFQTSHDGRKATTIAITPIRLACTNQMNLAFRTARQKWAVRHVGDPVEALKQAHVAAGYVERYEEEYRSISNKLMCLKVSTTQMDNILNGLLPDRPKREQEVAAIKDLALNAATNELGRGTAYGLLNATREYYDHVRPHRTSESAFIGSTNGVNKATSDRLLAELLRRADKK